ncbi:hypothetical protein M422DRAFT_35316 [Sphaerobolus stellatus SS14]|uniref:Uncharacterized protein n=1 Tax=Sphaerobolus stellatus (strain SS14) TaxID=990650 RepID=A0A0C9V9F3_SPHS4|nr:hypothetical protein M422DRAFT_35316 [Sphaerobolus stellatus SS14]
MTTQAAPLVPSHPTTPQSDSTARVPAPVHAQVLCTQGIGIRTHHKLDAVPASRPIL